MKIAGMVKLGAILAAFAAAACVLLAFVYAGTSRIIAERAEADQQMALRGIFPDADSFEPAAGIESGNPAVSIQSAFKAVKDGAVVGAAMRLSRAGYAGPIVTMVGISTDGIITGVRIIEHSETPGLGANAASPSFYVNRANRLTFYGQFTGKQTSDPFMLNNDVTVISASTITSYAIASTVRAAGLAAIAWFAGLEAGAVSADAVPGATEGGMQ